MQLKNYNDLSVEQKELLDQAKLVSNNAYAPYSNFKVGAAVRLANNKIICGNNQENAAYGACLCAERVALLYATSNYYNDYPISIAIAAQNTNGYTSNAITPCGECRQVLVEIENRFNTNIEIIMFGQNEIIILQSAKELLPLTFNNSML